jgi:hypothetical protein
VAVLPIPADVASTNINEDAIQRITESQWFGQANRLSPTHVEWEIIDEAARQSWKGFTTVRTNDFLRSELLFRTERRLAAERIIQQRRSCLALDGITTIDAQKFYQILSAVVPSINPVPFDLLDRSSLAKPHVHLALFVHRVIGIDPGLYILVREKSMMEAFKSHMSPDFLWSIPSGCPDHLNLFLLKKDDVQRVATSVSCGQDIAGDGVFSLGMIAEFEESIKDSGGWFYRRLFWETGIVGQILYLEAEAAGIRSTGIGCFFDDPVHETFGLHGRKFQSLYHFTIGGAVEDTRLTTEPPYTKA